MFFFVMRLSETAQAMGLMLENAIGNSTPKDNKITGTRLNLLL